MIKLLHVGEHTEGRPLVVVPGIDGSIGSVQPIVEVIANDRPVFVTDYTKEDNRTLEALAEEIAGVIGAQLDGSFDLMGQSIGTIAASQVAGSHLTERVRHTVLMCTFTDLTDWRLKMGNFSLQMTPDWLYRSMAPVTMAYICGPVGDGEDHPFFDAARHSSREAVIRRTAWQIDRDFSSEIASVPDPLLVLMGKEDRFVPDSGREIDKLSTLLADRSARVVPIPEGGHVFLDSTAIAAALSEIRSFLGSPG